MIDSKVKGTIVRFFRGRGFGFIKPEEGSKEVFVHWEDLVTDDPWPYVEKGTEVEFHMNEDDGKCSAKNVTLAGGEEIPAFTKPYEDREVNEDEVFVGAIKFFDGRKGFGFVEPDQEISWGEVNAGEGLFFKRDSFLTINAGKGMMLKIPDGMRVSFKVYKDKKGLGACEIQKEDQTPIEGEPRIEKKNGGRKRKRKGAKGNKKAAKKVKKTKEELIEEREIDEEETTYLGTVKYYKPEKEFGFITIAEDITFKDITVKEKIFVMKEDIVCYADQVDLTADSEVMFKIYKDSKGLGACEVMNADGTPITGKEDNEAEAEMAKEPSPEPTKPKKKAAGKGRKKKVVKRKNA